MVTHGLALAIDDFRAAKKLEGGQNPDTLIGLAYALTQAGSLSPGILKTLNIDPDKTAEDLLQKALIEISAAKVPTRAQAASLVEEGKFLEAASLYHNSATVYAQCLPLLEKSGGTPAQHNGLIRAAAERLLDGLKVAQQDSQGAFPQIVEALRSDRSLAPLHSEPVYLNLLRQLGLPLPTSARNATEPE